MEREQDYGTIAAGLHFSRGKAISDHEYALVPCSSLETATGELMKHSAGTSSGLPTPTSGSASRTTKCAVLQSETSTTRCGRQIRSVVQSAGAKTSPDRLRCMQLNKSMTLGRSYAGYTEAPVVFRPTYKCVAYPARGPALHSLHISSRRYDNGTDDYDSSEKQRIPAYTDRILYQGEGVRVTAFSNRSACLLTLFSPAGLLSVSACRAADF